MGKRTGLWVVYEKFDEKFKLVLDAFEMTEEEKKIVLKDLVKQHCGDNGFFVSVIIAFSKEQAIKRLKTRGY